MNNTLILFLQVFYPICLLFLLPAKAMAYDPLAIFPGGKVMIEDFTVMDPGRHREIPLRVYLPSDSRPAPVVLFSHGLGGSSEGSEFLGRHWAGRGYVAVFLQHPGSDTSVWEGKPMLQRMDAMKEAANVQNFLLRVQDVAVVIDRLETWNKQADHSLAGRLDLERVGMSGHSFGAITTQAVSGQKVGLSGDKWTDSRIKAAIAFSPSVPAVGDAKTAFGSVSIPWMLMTGTEDTSRIGGATAKSRRQVYAALPPGGKYELVLLGAEHSVFTDRALPGDHAPRNPNHHRAITALSTAFWDAWLRGDVDARNWLNGKGAGSVIEPGDLWQCK